MRSHELLDAIGEAREEYVLDAQNGRINKIPRWATVVAAAACICLIICIALPGALGSMPNIPSPDEPQPLLAPLEFSSFEEFEQYEKSLGENGEPFYYIPSALTDDYTLSQITKREDVYITVMYTVPASNVDTEGFDDYDLSQLKTMICKYSLYEDGSIALNQLINNGYMPVEYTGRTYYRKDEHAGMNDPNMPLTGYEIAFLEDGKLIYMHLPAIDTFENMMKFTDVVKVEIE